MHIVYTNIVTTDNNIPVLSCRRVQEVPFFEKDLKSNDTRVHVFYTDMSSKLGPVLNSLMFGSEVFLDQCPLDETWERRKRSPHMHWSALYPT